MHLPCITCVEHMQCISIMYVLQGILLLSFNDWENLGSYQYLIMPAVQVLRKIPSWTFNIVGKIYIMTKVNLRPWELSNLYDSLYLTLIQEYISSN